MVLLKKQKKLTRKAKKADDQKRPRLNLMIQQLNDITAISLKDYLHLPFFVPTLSRVLS